MLHAKFQDYRNFYSREEDVSLFYIYGRGSHLGHVTSTIYANYVFVPPCQNLALIDQAVSDKKMFENNGNIQCTCI